MKRQQLQAQSPGTPDDAQLAADVKALLAVGDREAACTRFEMLVDRHQRRAARIADAYLRDRADADEAVQDAFVKAFVHLPSYRATARFDLWFTQILVNGCMDRLRVRRNQWRWLRPTGEDRYGGVENQPSRASSPEATLLATERDAQLQSAIAALPERQRSVVILHQLEGHKTREVGAMLGVSEATVRVHLFRALRALRARLSSTHRGRRRMVPSLGGAP